MSNEKSSLMVPTPDPAAIALDAYVALLAEDVECANMQKWWAERRKVVQARLKAIMGACEVGTVNGQEVVHYERQNRFNSTDFRKKYPALYEAYMVEHTRREFDADLLKHSQPDIYQQFQVRSMRISFEPPGSKETPGVS